jgi:hypothetical protein
LPAVCIFGYESLLFKAAFTMAFCLTEIAKSSGSVRNVISVYDVSITNSILDIYIPSFKTDQYGNGCTVAIHAQSDQNMCPLKATQAYLNVRPPTHGPLFCHFDGSDLSRYQVVAILKKSLLFAGIDCSRFSSHSFRIGAATNLYMVGLPDDLIMRMGRWISSDYRGYIRS